MSNAPFSKADLARDLRRQFPKHQTRSLARKLYKDNIESFKDEEDARQALIYADGKGRGKGLKPNITAGTYNPELRPLNPWKLPEAVAEDFKPYVISGKRHKRILIINDIHLPYHSLEALNIVIAWAKKEKVDAILINGDMLDFYQLSRFEKNPKARSFAGELEAGRQFLERLAKILRVPIYYKLGNHEERYEKFLQAKAPELLGVEDFELKNLLRLSHYDARIITDKRIVKLNSLNVLHGHEFTAGFIAPVNVARGLFLRAKVAAIQGHNHQSSDHTEKDLNGKIVTTWSIGCLCGLTPAYCRINKWNWGAAIVDLDSNGKEFEVHNKRIFNQKIY